MGCQVQNYNGIWKTITVRVTRITKSILLRKFLSHVHIIKKYIYNLKTEPRVLIHFNLPHINTQNNLR